MGIQREVAHQRLVGAYYTPPDLALQLTRWALAGQEGPILDPSFGGCSFLRAARTALLEIGSEDPLDHIYGVDIDPAATHYVQDLFAVGLPEQNVLLRNFFEVNPDDLCPERFAAVVGNPPYIRHHWFQGEARSAAAAASLSMGVHLDQRSSAWAYFVIHSLRFLRLQGRLALILPNAFLHADYARTVISALESHFSEVTIVALEERLFEDAAEGSVVLLCANRGGQSQANLIKARSRAQLFALLQGSLPSSVKYADWRLRDLGDDVLGVFEKAISHPQVRQMRDIATVKIGVVTGANEFFVKRPDDIRSLGLTLHSSRPLAPRMRLSQTLRWTVQDQKVSESKGEYSRLLVIPHRLTPAVQRYISSGESNHLAERLKCRAREVWYQLDEYAVPDAFVPYMGTRAPHIVVNRARATVTNNVHRIWFRGDQPQASIALGSLSSLWKLSCELTGRSYGGGVLKMEPSELSETYLPVISASGVHLRSIDTLLRAGNHEQARMKADEIILKNALGLSDAHITLLAFAAHRLASERRGIRLPKVR